MGMGKRPEDITIESPMFRAVSVHYEQAIGATADVPGLELDEIRHSIETGTSPHDVEVACGTLPAGTVVGQIMPSTPRPRPSSGTSGSARDTHRIVRRAAGR